MAERRVCAAGHEHWWPGEKWKHEGCVAIKPAAETAIKPAVVNRKPSAIKPRSANRRDRGVYNAYMNAYMKVWKMVKAGRADWWPRRASGEGG